MTKVTSPPEAREPHVGGSKAACAFLLATDLLPREPAWRKATAQARAVAAACAPILGFEPTVRLAAIGGYLESRPGGASLDSAIAREVDDGATEVFVLPVALDFNLFQRESLGQTLGESRRRHAGVSIYHDDVDPGHPLLVECLADQVARALAGRTFPPQRTGVILVASGHGDAASRAQSYRLMRLVWEQLSLGAGEIGFLRNAQPFLLPVLEKCAKRALEWVVLPQAQWKTEHVEYAELILRDFQRSDPDTAEWRLADAPGDHPAMTAWLTQRVTRLWQQKRTREAMRAPSPRRSLAAVKRESWNVGHGSIAVVPDRRAMSALLGRVLPAQAPARVLVKVTWHGYATGTHTDPAALDLLLSALPARAVILEGHTSSRNLENAPFDWETEARENRAWIRQQEAEYLRRTGLADVLARHHAEYVNVTEMLWDDACAPAAKVNETLRECRVKLQHPELAGIVPEVLLAYRGCPLISFAKFKGPTRLGISNLFGLLPEPLRAAWHGPNITYFARVCCDVAKLYGTLFPICGVNEALYSAVRWNRQGLYRSRWGNYDLISNSGYVTASRDLVSADILASRLQGQDVRRSAFFEVVRAELGWDEAAATEALPAAAVSLFA